MSGLRELAAQATPIIEYGEGRSYPAVLAAQKRLGALAPEMAALLERAQPFLRHARKCEYWIKAECTCGLDEISAEFDALNQKAAS